MIVNGWYHDKEETYPGEEISYKVEQVLDHHRSQYQDILVFESASYGKVLVLDDAMICTEKDEFVHHEMIAHIPLFSHSDPKRVLVIGGGAGGIIREIVKHTCVEEIVVCEIDMDVIEACKKYFPEMSKGFNDPRVKLQIMDGIKFLETNKDLFDVIIAISSAPIGSNSVIFESTFYDSLHASLREGGIVCTQGELTWTHIDVAGRLVQAVSKLYSTVEFVNFYIPTCFGQIGFIIATKGRDKCNRPARCVSADFQASLQYYTPDVHMAAFLHLSEKAFSTVNSHLHTHLVRELGKRPPVILVKISYYQQLVQRLLKLLHCHKCN